MLSARLYTRPDCHLCDEARELIEGMRPELAPFELTEVDIDSDESLFRAYLERIPVLEVDGEIVGELTLDPDAVRAAFSRRKP